jgi:hypothetical protein
MKYIAAILGLWSIALLTTLLIIDEAKVFTYLGPVYFICMVGSALIVRRAQARPTARDA